MRKLGLWWRGGVGKLRRRRAAAQAQEELRRFLYYNGRMLSDMKEANHGKSR